MKLSEIQQLFARDVVRLLMEMDKLGYKYTFGETYRTAEQAEIYHKEGIGIKNSLHCKRLAIDINLFKDGVMLATKEHYQPIGLFWESLCPMNRWGGNFTKVDADHFERNEKQS